MFFIMQIASSFYWGRWDGEGPGDIDGLIDTDQKIADWLIMFFGEAEIAINNKGM